MYTYIVHIYIYIYIYSNIMAVIAPGMQVPEFEFGLRLTLVKF
jgi:hypothetical protein